LVAVHTHESVQGHERRRRNVRYQIKATGPPPMKWSDSKYGFAIEEDCHG